MQQKDFVNQSGYRIKKHRNNYLFDDHMKEDEDDLFKMSIHSSSNKTPLKTSPKKNNRQLSVTNKNSDHDKFSYRSKRSNNTNQNRSNMSSSNVSGGSRRIQQSKNIKQFANVKQLLMIKAYDKKLLRNVTGSSEANKNFLKLGDVRNDPFRKETFKVMIQNFKQLTIRIRKGYEKVLNKILFQNTSASAIHTLASVQPLLEKVRIEADDMCFKVKQCQQTHDSRQFRGLLQKFLTFLNAAQDIEQIILIVNDSKIRIDNLFKNLEKDKHLDDKVNVQRKKGIKKVRNAVKDYGIDGIQAQILNKVQAAINQMADKNLQAYSKINGARGLMIRIKQCLQENKQYYELQDIVKINQIFKQVLHEAKSYERFVQKFMQEGDIVNDDLRACIIKYREQVQIKKQAVQTMELKFIANILQTSINTFQANYSVCNAIDSTVCSDFTKVQALLQSICELISNENAKINIKAMLKDISPHFKHIQKQIKKLKNTPKSIAVDTEEGLQILTKLNQLINQYKSNIRQIVDAEQRAYREITKRRVRRQNIADQDLQQSSIQKIITLSKKLSSPKRKQSIQKCKAFHSINKYHKIQQLAAQIGDIKLYKQFRTLYQQLQELQHNNQISSLVNQLRTQEKLYVMSALFVDAHQIATSTTQQTLLKSIENINMKHKSNNTKSNKILDNFIERIYCLIILKGLDKKTIKIINDNKLITFPNNQHDVQTLKRDIKYLKTITNILPQVLVKNNINHSCTVMEQVLEGVRVSEELKWNTDRLYYVQGQKIFKCIADSFHGCFVEKKGVQIEEIRKSIKQICHNLQKLEKKQKSSEYSNTRVERVIQIINRYELINKKLQEKLKKIQNCQHLQGYAQLVFSLAQYLTGTLQSFNATLNKDGNMLWICEYENQNPKYSKFGSFIGLNQLKPGQKQTKYNQKEPIKAKKEQPKQKQKEVKEVQNKNKTKTKNKSNQIQDMDEQIKSDNQQMGDDMIEDMGQQIGDDMEQDMPEQNMEQQMDEQMDDQVQEDGLIVDVEDDIINDIDDSMLDSGKKDRNSSKLTNKKLQKKQSPIPVKKEPQNPSPIKNEAKKQVEIIIKQKILKKTLQKFKYIQKLQDLQVLLQKIRDIRMNYWKNMDLTIISQYLNREGKDQIQKTLIQELQKFCKGQYFPEFISSIKNSDAYKGILKEIDELNLLKFGSFVEILKLIKKQYACLMGVNKQLLRLCIKKDQKWKASQCIQQYITKQLKIAGLKLQDFNTQQYINQLITTNKKLQTKYELGDKKTQIKGQLLKQKVANIEKIIKQYQDISKFPDGNNVYEMVIKMWYNCLGKEHIEIDVPKKLDSDIDELMPITNSLYSISYLTNLKKQANKTLQILQIHLGKLQHVLKTFKKENIQQKISQIINIYKIDKIHIILFEGHPILIREIIPSSFSKPELKPIKSLLLPQDKNITQLKSEQIRTKLKSQPQLFAQFHKQISIILSMLQIQCHIWPSSTVLHICQNRDDTIKIIVNIISNGIIKDAQQQLQNINQINKSLLVANHQPLIFEYRIKQDVSLMSGKKNQEYYKQYLRIVNVYKQKKNTKYEVGDTIFENIFRLEDSDNSITTQIFDYTQTLSLLLKQKVFQDNESIFMYHIPTQTQLDKIKKQIDSEVRLLLSIIQQPIQINVSQPLKALGIMQERNNLVAKWYKQHRKVEKKGLCQINICVCLQGKCDRQYTLYVGEIQDHMVDYFNKLIQNKKIYDTYIKKYQNVKNVSEWKQSKTIHIGKITRQISNKLKNMDTQMYCNFINYYNLIHFIKNQNKNKHLLQLYNKLIKQNQSKIEIVKIVQQVVQKLKKNGVIGNLLQQNLEEHLGSTLGSVGKNYIEEKQKLSQVNVTTTQYTKFGNWIINVVGKIHKIPFAILFDNQNKQDLVCIIPTKTPEELQSALKVLKLPTQYTQIEQKHTYKKIHLNQQSIFFKFDETQISKQELIEFSQDNFGIDKPETEQKQTWVLGVYRKIHLNDQEDQNLLLILPLDHELIQKLKQIQLNINQTEIKAEIQFKILEVKIKKGQKAQEDGIIRQLNSQKYANVYLNDNLTITALPRWLKNELKKLRDKKKAEKEKAQLLLKQQKQKEEEQRRKQQQRIRLQQQRKKKQEQQAKKKQEQQKKKLAQIPTDFILDSPTNPQKSLIQQQSSLYLDKIYKQLTDNQIYTIDKKEVKQKNKKKEHEGIKLNSNKNIELKTNTQKIINNMQSILQGQVQKQFHRIAQIYLQSVDELLYTRQQILNQIFKIAMEMKQQPSENIQSQFIFSALQENLNKIIDQLSTRQNYNQNIKPRIRKSISQLPKQKKQKLYSIYQKKNSF